MPSATLLGQALISGVLAGGLYGLLAMGLSLSWGLLRLVLCTRGGCVGVTHCVLPVGIAVPCRDRSC